MNVRKANIINWLSQEEYQENRDWKKGKARKYTDQSIAENICKIKKERIEDKRYFVGSPHVQMDYENQFPKLIAPKTWYIDKVIREAGLQTKKPKKRKKGGSEYLLFPTQCVRNLGYIQQSADFIGKKYILGRSEPINIFSSSYYSPFKLYQIKQILAEKSIYAMEELVNQWETYPIPNVFREDNGLQFRSTAKYKRMLGMFLRFLLNLNVAPLFSSPSKP